MELCDLTTSCFGVAECSSVESAGNEVNGDSGPDGRAISADGRYAAWSSHADNQIAENVHWYTQWL